MHTTPVVLEITTSLVLLDLRRLANIHRFDLELIRMAVLERVLVRFRFSQRNIACDDTGSLSILSNRTSPT